MPINPRQQCRDFYLPTRMFQDFAGDGRDYPRGPGRDARARRAPPASLPERSAGAYVVLGAS